MHDEVNQILLDVVDDLIEIAFWAIIKKILKMSRLYIILDIVNKSIGADEYIKVNFFTFQDQLSWTGQLTPRFNRWLWGWFDGGDNWRLLLFQQDLDVIGTMDKYLFFIRILHILGQFYTYV